MTLLIDTHVLAWAVAEPWRLSMAARDALIEPGAQLYVSGCTAWEYADLHTRGRLPEAADFGAVADALAVTLLDTPASLWRLAVSLPDIHRDPIDRILTAHAIHADLTLVTADHHIRRYPVVRTLW